MYQESVICNQDFWTYGLLQPYELNNSRAVVNINFLLKWLKTPKFFQENHKTLVEAITHFDDG